MEVPPSGYRYEEQGPWSLARESPALCTIRDTAASQLIREGGVKSEVVHSS